MASLISYEGDDCRTTGGGTDAPLFGNVDFSLPFFAISIPFEKEMCCVTITSTTCM